MTSTSAIPDWLALASVLLDRDDVGSFVLDADGTVVLLNTALERTLGWKRKEVFGLPWSGVTELLELPSGFELGDVLRGIVSRVQCVLPGPAGAPLQVTFALRCVGQDGAKAVIVSLQDVAPAARGNGGVSTCRYEISTRAQDYFRVMRAWPPPEEDRTEPRAVGKRCYEFIYGKKEPCPDCPVGPNAGGPWPRLAVIHRSLGQGSYEVISAELIDDARVALTVQVLPASMFEMFMKARLEARARQAKLSDRELSVLRELVRGASLPEVAERLDISPRTAKFHQGNILTKLNLSSRADLFQLLF